MGKRGPASKGGPGHTLGVRCQRDLLKRLDQWREMQPIPPTRTAAMRHLAELGLEIETKHTRAPRRLKFTID
jgi:hypothetical protein